MRSLKTFVRLVVPVVALIAVETPARADDARCLAAFDATQRLHKDGKLRAAREEAVQCALAGCPAVVVRECATWVSQLDAEIPTVAFTARSNTGQDLVDVEVVVDGESLTKRLDGRAVALEPGPHRVRLLARRHAPKDIDVLLAEGDKNRRISVELTSTEPASPPPSKPTVADRATDRRTGVPVLTWVFGGIAIAGAAGSAFFAIDGFGKKSDLDASGCRPYCADDNVSAAERSFVIADVLGAVAIISAGAAIVTYLTRSEPARSSASVSASSFGLDF